MAKSIIRERWEYLSETGYRVQRKLGCKAHIVCVQYILHPDYRVTKKQTFVTKRNERAEKEVMLNELRKDLASCSVREVKYHVSLQVKRALTTPPEDHI